MSADTMASRDMPQMSLEAQTNTARPVAFDFSEGEGPPVAPLKGKRVIMALSAAAILAGFVTLYSAFGGSNGKPPAVSADIATAAQPRAVNSLQPAAPDKKADAPGPLAAAATKPTETHAQTSAPGPETNAAEAAPSSNSRERGANAPARYSVRGEGRRRWRNSASEARESRGEEGAAASTAATANAAEPERNNEVATTAAEEETDTTATEAPKSTGGKASSSNGSFNREAAKTALDEAASQAKNCRPQGGPTGSGRVQVKYEASGKVASVSILTSKFDNTTAGSCVRMLFRRAHVPEFTGAPVVVNKSFEIP